MGYIIDGSCETGLVVLVSFKGHQSRVRTVIINLPVMRGEGSTR